MLRAISDTAVAINVASVREKPRLGGQLTGLLARLDDVGVAVDADPDLVIVSFASLQQRSAQPRADVALEQVPGGVDLPLPAPIGTGQGEQHRTALWRRRLRVL